MEKVKEKLSALRAEVDEANNVAEEYKEKIKQQELEQTSKDHEILSLQIRVKNLEDQLKKAEDSLLKTNNDFHNADAKAEEAQAKTEKLEQELVDKEQLNEELDTKFKTVKSEIDELARQFEDL